MTSRAGLLAVAAVLVAACGGSATTTTLATTASTAPTGGASAAPAPTPTAAATPVRGTPTAPPTAAATPDPCAVAAQSPPQGTMGANYPTALAFAPDGRLFWTERSGAVRVWQNGAAKTFATVSTVTTERDGSYSERGLLGLAISPTFATDHFVYAFYSATDYTAQKVVRWRDCGGTGTAETQIIGFPSGSDCCHKGGRLAFGADGKLYVTLGEEHTAAAAQNVNDVRGKILRYNPDGSVPADNPFGATNPVWAYGFRNPFGIAVSASGQIAVTNNGPSGDAGSPGTGYDDVVLNLVRGGGYQWPNCYGYSHPLGSTCGAGQLQPDWSSEQSTVVPTGAAFIDASGPAPFAGHLVFCTYDAGMRIVTPGSPHATVAAGPSTCTLDVKQGPDHAVYWSDTGHIYRQG